MNNQTIRLCSASETRAKLLKEAGISFMQSPVDYDEEQITADTPKSFVYQASAGKFEEAVGRFGYKDYPVLAADTVVASRGKILRKAQCVDEARDILLTQSESVTSIITCMIYQSSSLKLIDISATDYIFAKFDRDDIERYLDSGEWQGKAGACMVEGFCKRYIKEVRGYESTAMGLSVEVLRPFL